MVVHKECLRVPPNANNFELFKGGGMEMDEKLLACTIAWILVARGDNHATLMTEDLIHIHVMKERVKIDWDTCEVDNILKTKRLSDYQILYAVFLTKVNKHYEVDFTDEKFKILISINKFDKGLLSYMALVERDGRWYYREEALEPKIVA